MTTGIALVLATWVAVSLAYQVFPEVLGRLRQHDVLGLIPNYKFFAPDPVTYDLVLLVRTRSGSGRWGDWSALEAVCNRRAAFSLFNPYRRTYKTLSDLVSALLKVSENHDVHKVACSTPALALADYVRAQLLALRDSPGTYEMFSYGVCFVHASRHENTASTLGFVSPAFPIRELADA